MFIQAHRALFSGETQRRFYGKDGKGGAFSLDAHEYLAEITAPLIASIEGKVLSIGCGIQRLPQLEAAGRIVDYLDVTDYGLPYIKVTSLLGDEELAPAGSVAAALVAQAPAPLGCAKAVVTA